MSAQRLSGDTEGPRRAVEQVSPQKGVRFGQAQVIAVPGKPIAPQLINHTFVCKFSRNYKHSRMVTKA